MAENSGLSDLVAGAPTDNGPINKGPKHIRDIINFLNDSSYGIPAIMPVGVILAFGGVTPPTGWLLCNGGAVSRTTYPKLFDVIGTFYGSGDGATTFNLPDAQRRYLLGAGGSKQFVADTSEGQLASAEIDTTLGSTGGEEKHVMLRAELPADKIEAMTPVSDSPSNPFGNGETAVHTAVAALSTGVAGLSEALGSGLSMNNMPPSLTVNYIIRAF
jgi:microcystin-dependent protein